jgi:hypothetical protein
MISTCWGSRSHAISWLRPTHRWRGPTPSSGAADDGELGQQELGGGPVDPARPHLRAWRAVLAICPGGMFTFVGGQVWGGAECGALEPAWGDLPGAPTGSPTAATTSGSRPPDRGRRRGPHQIREMSLGSRRSTNRPSRSRRSTATPTPPNSSTSASPSKSSAAARPHLHRDHPALHPARRRGNPRRQTPPRPRLTCLPNAPPSASRSQDHSQR